jgi:hypothetical protein
MPLSSDNSINKMYMFYGIHNFNNFFNALQIVFQLVTNEAWSSYMYALMDADSPWFAVIYTICIVVIGSFFLMNLILAVIINAFITITRRELEEEQKLLMDEEVKSGRVITDEILNELSENDEMASIKPKDASKASPEDQDDMATYLERRAAVRKSIT